MVFQRKSRGKGNKSPFQGKNKKPFEHDSELDDQLMKKTPKGGTPKGKQASFQIPGKNTPANRTPKFVAKTPNSGEKKLLTPRYKGTTMKEFQGMKAGFNRPKNGKVKDDDSSDDDEEDDGDNEDFDLDLGSGDDENECDDKDDDENEGDNKDDEDNNEDDDDEDDDDEVEMLDKHKKVMETNKEEKVKTPKSEKVEATKPGKKTQVVKSEAKSSPKKVPDQKVQAITSQMKSFREEDLRTLYMGNLPPDIEQEEIKRLSSDILEVKIPKSGRPELWKGKTRYAFVKFISEEKAEANYKDLQEKTLRGAKLIIDFTGEKSSKRKYSKMLSIMGFPLNTTIDKIAEIFPESSQITLTNPQCAHVTFGTFEEAAAGFEAGIKATVKGSELIVKYLLSDKAFSSNKRKEHFKKPFQKKMKFVK